jgi:hypothetical protein
LFSIRSQKLEDEMSETEIALARAYLIAAGQDPVAALIRSVKDLAKTRELVSPGYVRGEWPGLALQDERQRQVAAAPEPNR